MLAQTAGEVLGPAACTRTRRGWWSFAVRRSRSEAPARVAASPMGVHAHYWGRSRKGRWVVKRKTAPDRFSRALKGIGQWCRNHRHETARPQAVVELQAEGSLSYSRHHRQLPGAAPIPICVERLWRKWLGRRSHRGRMTDRFARLRRTVSSPAARVVHRVYRLSSETIVRGAGCLIGQVRICGSRGWATTRATRPSRYMATKCS